MHATTATLLTALALAAPPARADRPAEFSSQLVGADADTAGVTILHEAKQWTMKVREAPGKTERTIAVAAPADHGDYVIFVAPGRKQIAWVRVGDVKPLVATEPAVWIYGLGATATEIPFEHLFTPAELAGIPRSTAGSSWISARPTWTGGTLAIATHLKGVTVAIDAAHGTATRSPRP